MREVTIGAEHLARRAYVYLRHSSCSAVPRGAAGIEGVDALRAAITALGWDAAQSVEIEDDLGRPGHVAGRCGFRRLLEDVRRGRAGIVVALDLSRLARKSSDALLLVASCAEARTLLLVNGVLCDPARPEDRRLLGIEASADAPARSEALEEAPE